MNAPAFLDVPEPLQRHPAGHRYPPALEADLSPGIKGPAVMAMHPRHMTRRLNPAALVMVGALHFGILAALIAMPQPQPSPPPPIMASLIVPQTPPKVETPPRPLPSNREPQPLPPPKPHSPLPVLSAAEPAPTPVTAPPQPPEPVSVPAVLPAPAPIVEKAAGDPAAPPATPAPRSGAIAPPRFDADYLDNPAPAYPALSRRLGEEGRVLLRVYVLADGSAGQVEIHQSSGYDRLDRAAREAVARWRFVPARQGGETVAAWVLVPISFSLRS